LSRLAARVRTPRPTVLKHQIGRGWLARTCGV